MKFVCTLMWDLNWMEDNRKAEQYEFVKKQAHIWKSIDNYDVNLCKNLLIKDKGYDRRWMFEIKK